MFIVDLFSSFILTMIDAGLTPPKEIIADGSIYRFSSNGKPNDKSGYYAFFSHHDGFCAGFFGCWRTGLYSTWSSRHESSLSDYEQKLVSDCKLKAEQARRKVHQDRAEYSTLLWKQTQSASTSHPYLVKKQLKELGDIGYLPSIACADFFMNEAQKTSLHDCLLIPIYDKDDNIQSLQAINGAGKKFFMKGGKMVGGRFVFHGNNERVYVCEGYATGASLYALTQSTVVVAFNAANLETVAPSLQELYPDSEIVVAADNDHQKEKEGKGNKGLEVAQTLLEKHQMAYSAPTFSDDEQGSDWNDFCCTHSDDEAQNALIQNVVTPPVIYENFDQCIEALTENNKDEEAFNAAIVFIKDASHLFVTEMRKELKNITGVDIGDIRKAIAQLRKSEEKPELTHSQIAEKHIETYKNQTPVGAYGKMWQYNQSQGIWEEQELSKIGVSIGKTFDDEVTCRKGGDYRSIASHVYDVVSDELFFDNVPTGIHTPTGFIHVDGKILRKSFPSANHRARFNLDIEPDFDTEPTKLITLLREAFDGCYPEEQIRQLQMLTGMTLMGLLPREQRVVLLYGAAGSGKSVYLRLIEALIPSRFRTNVSPLDLDSDYKVAALAGKQINLVPELDKEKPIPSAQFKAITGGDTVSAREPYGKVFSFTPKTACWFNGNYYPTTKDYTEGFWRRWTIVRFVNTKSATQRNPNLLDEIVSEELSAFLGWALKGTLDYLENGLYLSPAHNESLEEWRRDGNSVLSWLNASEDNNVGPRCFGFGGKPLRITHAYNIYQDWCKKNNRKAFNSQGFKAYMDGQGYTTTTYNGYTCYDSLFDARPKLDYCA
ncbi:TPA: phage/plasmid primase, P4 family [Photobacterium damselae]